MKTLLGASALSLVLLAGVSHAAPADQPGHQSPPPNTSNDTASAVKDAAGHAVGLITVEMTTTTKGFAQEAAVSDMYEVEAGKIAKDRGHSAAVRHFGAEMVAAHTTTTSKLKAALKESHADVVPPDHVDDRRQGMLDELRGAKAEDFDNRYLAQQVAAHNETLILMRGYAKDGDNGDVKTLAAKTVPLVQKHLDMAQKLANDVKS